MHTPSQEKPRNSKFKKTEEQNRRSWVSFSIGGDVAGLIYFSKHKK